VISGLELRDRGTDMRLDLRSGSDAELELWAAQRHIAPFEKMVGKPVVIEVTEAAATGPRPTAIADAHRRAARA
jgi:hypothetical protein